MKRVLIAILILIPILYGIKLYNKCSRLEQENTKLKLEQDIVRDIIEKENKLLHDNILILEDEISYYRCKIDSLEKVKQKVIKTEYIVSENITEGVALLRENLKCEKY